MAEPHCPRCERQPLAARTLRDVPVKVCAQCKGISMGRADAEAVIALVGWAHTSGPHNYFDRLSDTATFQNAARGLRCPECRYDMHQVNNRGLVVDFCLNCQTLWFDGGELKTALDRARADGSLTLVPHDVGDSDTVHLIGWMLERLS